MRTGNPPLLLVFGPAGAGKSTLGCVLAESFGFHHVELDRFPLDGIDAAGLREVWTPLAEQVRPGPMIDELRRRVHVHGARGAVLTLPSSITTGAALLDVMAAAGLTSVLLYGTRAECLAAFLARERQSGRNIGAAHWEANNARAYALFGHARYDAYRVDIFRDGRFRDAREIAEEAIKKAPAGAFF